MKFRILAVGKIKEQYLKDAIAEYAKRLSRFCSVEIVEIDEFLVKGTPNDKEIELIKREEAAMMASKLEGYVVAMDIDGKQLSSVELSQQIAEQKQFNSTFTFVIGSSFGLADEIKAKANLRCSFGKITLPHQLFRVVLLEQLYRACCIERNVPYHK